MLFFHKGTWSFECQMHGHFIAGMKGFYEVTDCGQFQGEQLNDIERTYYIAAVEMEWDYAPVKTGNLLDPSRYVKEPHFRGKGSFLYERPTGNFDYHHPITSADHDFTLWMWSHKK